MTAMVSGLAANVMGTLALRANATVYTSGKIIDVSATANQCAGMLIPVAVKEGHTGMIRRVRLKIDDVTWLNASVRVHFFRDKPVFTNADGGTFAAGVSESSYMGYCDVTIDQSFSDPLVKGIGSPAVGSEINFDTSVENVNVWAVLEARSSVTASALSHTFTLVVEVLQN